jgi:hypothetical protein
MLLLEDERSDCVNTIFDEREKDGEIQTLFSMLMEQAENFFIILELGQTYSDMSYIISS